MGVKLLSCFTIRANSFSIILMAFVPTFFKKEDNRNSRGWDSKGRKIGSWYVMVRQSQFKICFEIIVSILYKELEIKHCGLGSRIRDMKADLIYWLTFMINPLHQLKPNT